jgi:probable HAF family extracellular repeat protein
MTSKLEMTGRGLVVAGSLAGMLASAATAQIVEPIQYELFDLGTLGGPGSAALATNDLDQVVGWAETASGKIHGFVWQDGLMTDLGVLGTRFSEARDINNAGQIVGVSKNADNEMRAVYWFDGEIYDLGTSLVYQLVLPPDQYPRLFEANAINDGGRIVAVGTVEADDDVHTYLLIPLEPEDPTNPTYDFVEIGHLPQSSASQMVSRLQSAGAPNQQSADGNPQVCFGFGLNNFDQVVGASTDQAFLWIDEGLSSLEVAAFESQANAISTFGIAVGWTAGPAGESRAALWSMWMPGEQWALHTPPGWISEARDVNDATRSVGWSSDNAVGADAGAMLWHGTTPYDLNLITAVPEGPVFWDRLEEATGINNSNNIVGYGRTLEGVARAFILLPLDIDYGNNSDD